VLICEGEKAVDAARRIFPDHVVTTSSGGAKAFNHTDWAPLSVRCVVIWPDNDTAGTEYARAVARILGELECEVSVIDATQLVEIDGGKRSRDRNAEGWDAGDAVEEWLDLTALRQAALELAKPFEEDSQAREAGLVPTVPLYLGGIGEQESEEMGNDKQSSEDQGATRYSGTAGTVSEHDAILKRIRELRQFDEAGARAIIADVIKAGFPGLAVETLIKPLADALGVKVRAARKFWKDTERQVPDASAQAAKTDERTIGRERARLDREREERRDRLWRSCKETAESTTLLADMEEMVRKHGVVGESAAIRGAYLTASSRLNSTSAICLLRRGRQRAAKISSSRIHSR
jgi:DNA primase